MKVEHQAMAANITDPHARIGLAMIDGAKQDIERGTPADQFFMFEWMACEGVQIADALPGGALRGILLTYLADRIPLDVAIDFREILTRRIHEVNR